MFTRIRIAIGFAIFVILITSSTVFAKGGFSFIAISGKEEICSSNAALTADFFAFADFYRDETNAPADPGTGYEITRYYVDGKREIAFDRLHYHPETGFVYYDGIAGGGSSEYDREWYTAKPEIKTIFENALSIRSVNRIHSIASTASTKQIQPRGAPPPLQLLVLTIVGITGIFLFTYRLRKASVH